MLPEVGPSTVLDEHPEAVSRERRLSVDADSFQEMRERIRNGLRWGAGAVVTDSEDRVLLVCHGDHWTIPGGAVESSEHLRNAAKRETKEETGIEMRIHALGAVTEQTLVCDGDQIQFYFASFIGTARTTKLTATPGVEDEEIETVEWRKHFPESTIDRRLIERLC